MERCGLTDTPRRFPVYHGVDAASVLLGTAVFASCRGGGHDAALLLFDVDGGLPDVGGGESAGGSVSRDRWKTHGEGVGMLSLRVGVGFRR